MDPVPPPAFDSLVLMAVAEEMASALLGARVAGVIQPDDRSIGLLLRSAHTTHGFLCAIDPRWARCVITRLPDGRPAPHPFVLQLRARLSRGRLLAAEAVAFERVLTLTFETLTGSLRLIVEIMGRHSNVALIEADDRVAGVFKPVTPSMSRLRPLLPGVAYERPPRLRPTPEMVPAADIAAWLADGRPVAATLTAHLLGISPPVAIHLARQAGLDPAAPCPPDAAPRIEDTVRDLVARVRAGAFAPTLYRTADGTPAAYAALPLLTYAGLVRQPVASMSEAVVPVVEATARRAALEDIRRGLAGRVTDALRRLSRTEDAVRVQLADAQEAQRWRRWGELLLAYAPTIPARAHEATVPDFDGVPLTIPLEPNRSAVENAQRYFRRYAKSTAGREPLRRRLAALHDERRSLEQARVLVEQATSPDDLAELAQDLIEAGYGARAARPRPQHRPRPAPRARPAPRTFIAPGGFRILVGRSNRENDHLTFKVATPDDLWLHARGLPGAHVVLKVDGRAPGAEVIAIAARVAAYFSQGRSAGRVPVDVTARRHVRKPRGARPGMVTYREEQTLMVEPRLPGDVGEPGR